MFTKDNFLIINLQITLVGIILIIGLYLLWKVLTRLEDKISALSKLNPNYAIESDKGSFTNSNEVTDDSVVNNIEEDINTDEFMNNVFNDNDIKLYESESDINANDEVQLIEEEVKSLEEDDNMSKTSFTKTKLRQMTVDKLKGLCEESNLSIDGNKAQLIDRILSVE